MKGIITRIKNLDEGNKIVFSTSILALIFFYLFTYWNTNPILMSEKDIIKEEIINDQYTLSYYVGRRYDGELDIIKNSQELNAIDKMFYPFYLDNIVFEPTGLYMLLDSKYEGIVHKGKTSNWVSRDMFTFQGTCIRLYPGMYAELYVGTLEDNKKILIIVGCNERESVKAGDYKNIIANYYTEIPYLLTKKYYNKAAEQIENLYNTMDIEGCIWLGDKYWADRHDFGLFVMLSMKLILASFIGVILVHTIKYLFNLKKKKVIEMR